MSVLIIDDEPDIVEELVELLEFRGFAAVGTTDPQVGKRLVLSDPRINAVVVDIRMPDIAGDELAHQLRSALPSERRLRIFVVTGHAHCSDLGVRLASVAIDGFFTKPLDVNALIAALSTRGGVKAELP